jgi:hypothetical protein
MQTRSYHFVVFVFVVFTVDILLQGRSQRFAMQIARSFAHRAPVTILGSVYDATDLAEQLTNGNVKLSPHTLFVVVTSSFGGESNKSFS